MEPIIEAKALNKEVHSPYPLTILKGIELKINARETIAIQGASGSGKTTLLSLLAGLDSPTSGEIYLNGEKLHLMNEDQRAQARLKNVGFIFQNFDLMPHFSVLENVMLPLELKGERQAKNKASEFLEKVGLKDRMQHTPLILSGGEQQRVAIARAYVTKPKILFADEPTGSLDTATGENIINLLFSLNKEFNTTLVFVTHDNNLASLCQRKYLIDKGELV
jgi:putative ABC transport system ATP-binding protein